jgi:hypothetical protein
MILTIDDGPDAAGAESKTELGPGAAGANSELLRFSSETFERGRAAAPLGVAGGRVGKASHASSSGAASGHLRGLK